MNLPFKVKAIENRSPFIEMGQEYEVFAINLRQKEAHPTEFVFLVLTPRGFKTIESHVFTYETKLEKVLK
jgi:hypothetical protein